MTTKIASLAAGAAFLILTPAAFAADLPPQPAPYEAAAPIEPSAYDWTGFYVGAHGGFGFGKFEENSLGLGESDADGAIAGGQIGYNMQFGQWVVGLEADGAWTDINNDDDFDDATVDYNASLNWLATVRGRAGYAWDSVLVYATGGAAFGGVEYTDLTGDLNDDDSTQVGFAVGGGVEVAVTQNVSLKGEYLFVDLGEEDFGTATTDFHAHTVKGGINFKF